MSVYMIGVVYDKAKKLVGLRLFDTDDKKSKDCTLDGIHQYLTTQNKEVNNLALSKDGKLVCTNGEFGHYAKIILNKGIIGSSPLVVTKKKADGTYEVVNGHGESSTMSIMGIKLYTVGNGLANGRLVETQAGLDIVPYTNGAVFEEEKILSKEESHGKIDRKLRMFKGTDYVMENNEFVWTNDEATVVKVPNGIYELKCGAFDCLMRSGVKREIILPNTLKHIGADAFRGLAGVTELKLPLGLLTIGVRAFDASTITTIYLPPTVIKLSPSALVGIQKVYYYNREQKGMLASAVSLTTKCIYKPWKGEIK